MLTPSSGAGAGGVATAARLAKAGFDVTVIEKNMFTGGRCSLIEHEGYVRIPLSTQLFKRRKWRLIGLLHQGRDALKHTQELKTKIP